MNVRYAYLIYTLLYSIVLSKGLLPRFPKLISQIVEQDIMPVSYDI